MILIKNLKGRIKIKSKYLYMIEEKKINKCYKII